MTTDAFRIGIDLGGTKVEGVILGADGLERARRRVPTPRDYLGTVDAIVTIVRELEAQVELVRPASGLDLRVRDNGIGFQWSSATRGLGLRTMEQRARLIGGRLLVHTHPDGGVEVICSVPKTIVERART